MNRTMLLRLEALSLAEPVYRRSEEEAGEELQSLNRSVAVAFSIHFSALNSRGKSLGGKRRFTPPSRESEDMDTIAKSVFRNKNKDAQSSVGSTLEEMGIDVEDLPEKLRSLDERFIVNILNEIIYNGKAVTWDDIGDHHLSC